MILYLQCPRNVANKCSTKLKDTTSHKKYHPCGRSVKVKKFANVELKKIAYIF